MSCILTLVSAWSARHNGWRLAASLAFLMLAAPGVTDRAHAADAVPPSNSALADTTKPVTFLKQTVVTGARYPRAYYDSPQALSFLSRTDLKEQQPAVLGDAIYRVPGADNSKDSPWEQRPILRGLGGQQVLVLMNGYPVNSARGNGPHPSLIDESQVDRVEVVRGPSSVAYGSDALGGVINIITRQAPAATSGRSLGGSASLTGTSADKGVAANVQLAPQIGKASALVGIGGRKVQDFQTPDNGDVSNSSYKEAHAMAQVRYGLGDGTALRGGWQYYQGQDIGIPGLTLDDVNFHQDFEFPFYKRNQADLALEHSYSTGWLASTNVRTYWQAENRNFYSHEVVGYPAPVYAPPPAPAQGATRITNQDRYFDLNTLGLQVQATSRKTDRYLVTMGIDALQDHTEGNNVRHRTTVDSTTGTPLAPTSVRVTQSVPTGHFANYGGFVQSEITLAPEWKASLGARYTHYRYRADGYSPAVGFYNPAANSDDDAVAGSLGLVYALRSDLHLSANVANGYRQPNAQELYFSGPASVGYVVGNLYLKPEKSISTDLGLRWGPGSLAFSGNLFYSTYDDLIDAISIRSVPEANFAPTYQYVNITKARMWGGEAEAEWHFRPQWDARANCTGTIGDITSRQAIETLYGVSQDTAPLDGVPPFKGNASVRWTKPDGRFWVEPAMRYSWRTNRLPIPTPGVPQLSTFKKEWIVGDIALGLNLGHGQQLMMGVRNFTNRAYQLPMGSLEESGTSVYGTLISNF